MNIQSINQNRQQNFGMNFKVATTVLETPDALKEAGKKANLVLDEILTHITPEQRGELTIAMQQAGSETTVYMHQTDVEFPDVFEITRARKYEALDPSVSINSPVEEAKSTLSDEASAEAIFAVASQRAKISFSHLLSFIRRLNPIPESARTVDAVKKEMKVVVEE